MKSINHCPVCGVEQAQSTPYCRKCGADVRAVQMALDKPDIVTGAAGRDEILRAIADKIRRLPADKDLGETVKEILPKIEEVLESPEEKRLRHIRNGINYLSVGIGIAIYFILRELFFNDGSLALAAAIVASTVGLGTVVNGVFFSIPRNQQKKTLAELGFTVDEPAHAGDPRTTRKSLTESAAQPAVGVTEETTRQLSSEPQPDGR
ncbi:MAG: hypothetical protein ACREBD_23650 [Blastocatellia bacterium]